MTYRGSDIEILLTERQSESRKTKTVRVSPFNCGR